MNDYKFDWIITFYKLIYVRWTPRGIFHLFI